MVARLSRTKIDRSSTKVAKALDRALREAEFQPSRLTGLKTDFAEGWLPLPALHGLFGVRDDAGAMASLEEALRRHDQVFSAALLDAGMPKTVLDLLRNWMAVQMGTRLTLVEAAAAMSIRREDLRPGQAHSKRKQ
jgi:hypothetical protein